MTELTPAVLVRPRLLARRVSVRQLPLVAILTLSAVLNSWALSNAGWGNAYYSAAVRSMSQSWHNFVFASFEPGGFVSVDKPPLSLWVQTLSVKLFGFRPLALLIPQAVAGVLAVVFLHAALRRVTTNSAALVGSFLLAVTPIHVMVSHSNNLDAVLVCVMTGAAYLAIVAAQTGRFSRLIAASAVGGLAMTAKMLAGLPVMPGIALAFVWCAPLGWRRRIVGALVSVAVMAVVGLSWFALVDLTPKSQRPYVGSSATNSAFQLAFERNGANQVDGTQAMGGGGGPRGGRGFPGGAFPGGAFPGGVFPGGAFPGGNGRGDSGGTLGGLLPGVGLPNATGPGNGAGNLPGAAPGGFRRGPGGFGIPRLGFNGGTPGPLRLINTELGSQIAWFLPLGLVGAVVVVIRRRFRPSPDLAAVIVFGGWFVLAAGAFSVTKGIVHPYYLSSVAPPVAALAGLGFGEASRVVRYRRWSAIIVAAVLVTAIVQRTVLRRPDSQDWRPFLGWLAVGAVVAAVVAVIGAYRRRPRLLNGAALAAVALIGVSPLLWTQSSLANGVTPQLPYAQATGLTNGRDGLQPNGGFTFPTGDQKRLVAYLRDQRTSEKWLVAVQSAGQAESIIISSGEPVMTLGGFIGSDQIVTADQLRALIVGGDVRFFLIGAGGQGGQGGPGGGFFGGRGGLGNSASGFVATDCVTIPAATWQSGDDSAGETSFAGGPTSATFTLYDCAGLRE